jgi:hypothetical protein
MRDNDAALEQDLLNIAQAKGEAVILPHGIGDDVFGEAVAAVAVGCREHAAA